jgi:hypothetical protein
MEETGSGPVDRGIDPEIEARLVALERASDERRHQLQSVVQSLPGAVSRRELVRDSLTDLRAGGGLSEIFRRTGGVLKTRSRTTVDRLRRRAR